jgi:hypothetical protein
MAGQPSRHPGEGWQSLAVMSELFLLSGSLREDPAVEAWFAGHDPLRLLAREWFEVIRGQGPDVRVLMHDHCPTACVEGAAFAYVGAYKAHVSLGFFHGTELADPAGLLEGGGVRMRHVKIRWGRAVDSGALQALIETAYRDIRSRFEA